MIESHSREEEKISHDTFRKLATPTEQQFYKQSANPLPTHPSSIRTPPTPHSHSSTPIPSFSDTGLNLGKKSIFESDVQMGD